jgi:hypothetical protein
MKQCPRGTEIQSVRFDAEKWTARDARAWLLSHDMRAPAVDRTANQLRYRQCAPSRMTKGSFRTIELDKRNGISAVIGCPKKAKTSTRVNKEKSKPKKENPSFRWPRVVVQHGRCTELKIDTGDGKVTKFTWPKTGKNSMWLLTDTSGRRLFIAPFNKVSCTDAAFMKRIEQAGASAISAFEQWGESTGKAAEVGSIIKVAQRRIARIGRGISIVYYFDLKHRDGDPREHIFEKPPSVRADNKSNPKIIVISSSSLEVTRAGIEG